MKIQLSKGYEAEIDDADFDKVKDKKWFTLNARGSIYAIHRWRSEGKERFVLMHRLLTDAPKGKEVDHINGNGLDNRQANLRICSRAENAINRKLHAHSSSGVKGVIFEHVKGKLKIRGQVVINHKMYRKRFASVDEADAWCKSMRASLHGEFNADTSRAGQ